MMNLSSCENNMSFFDILFARSQWEDLVADYKLDDHSGHIDNLREFVKTGVKNNRFRPNFDEASQLAQQIIDYYDKEFNLSSVHRRTL